MSRYIDADVLIKRIQDEHKFGSLMLSNMIAEMPTADVVEVIRCKDCIHCADDWNGNQPMFTCEMAMCNESVQPNDYCSYAERKTNEQIR